MENKLTSGILGMEIIVRGRKIYFPDTPQLKNKRIKHIEFLNATALPKTHNNVTVVSDTANLLLTLSNQGSTNEVIKDLAVPLLTVKGDRLFINKIINFQKSYIEYTGAENQVGKAIFILFYYDEPAAWNMVQPNNKTSIKSLELKLTAKKTYFKFDENFTGRKILSIYMLFPVTSPLGSEVIAMTNIKNKFLTLSRRNVDFISNVPLSIFYKGDNYYDIRLQGVIPDLQRSFIYSLTDTVDDLKTVFFNVVLDDNK